MEKITKFGGPLTPTILGLAITTPAMACGSTIPVGPFCSNAFSHGHARLNLRKGTIPTTSYATDYEAVCQASAAQWSAVWWIVIFLGLVMMCAELVPTPSYSNACGDSYRPGRMRSRSR